MADKTNLLEWKLKAKDETGEAYASAKQKLHEFVHENIQTSRLLRHTLEGGGAGMIGQLVGESLDKAGESLKQFAEKMETAKDATAQMQVYHDTAKSLAESIPVVGSLVKGFTSLAEGIEDARAASAQMRGESEAVVNSLMSQESYLKKVTEQAKQQTEEMNRLREANERLAVTRMKGIGHSDEERESEALKKAHDDRDRTLKAELAGLRGGPDTEFKKTQMKEKNEEIARETADYQLRLSQIEETHAHARGLFQQTEHRNEEKRGFDHDKAMLDQAAAAGAAQLQLVHRDAEAEALLRKRMFESRKDESVRAEMAETAELSRAVAERSRTETEAEKEADYARTRALTQRIHNNAKLERDALTGTFNADEAKAAQDVKNQALDAQAERHKAIVKMNLDLLKEAGALGDKEAEQAAKILGSAEKYASEREHINQLLREGRDISTGERANLEAMKKALDEQEKVEKSQLLKPAKLAAVDERGSPFANSPALGFGDDGSRQAFAAGVQQSETSAAALIQKQLDATLAANAIHLKTAEAVARMAEQFMSISAV